MGHHGDSQRVAGTDSGKIAHADNVGLITRRSRVQITPPLLRSGNLRDSGKTSQIPTAADALRSVGSGVVHDGLKLPVIVPESGNALDVYRLPPGPIPRTLSRGIAAERAGAGRVRFRAGVPTWEAAP